MKAIDRPFTNIINGTSQFVIPVFQRDYTWQAETQCAQLWRDVLRAARAGGAHGHFLGSIVYVATGDSLAGFTRWLLIDGQQRLTTLTLLLAALRDHTLTRCVCRSITGIGEQAFGEQGVFGIKRGNLS